MFFKCQGVNLAIKGLEGIHSKINGDVPGLMFWKSFCFFFGEDLLPLMIVVWNNLVPGSVAGSLSRRFFDKLNKIAKNLKIFMEIDLIKYYHLIFFS